MDMIVSLLIQLISGAVGGNVAGMSKQGLGTTGNSVVGAIAGVVVAQVTAALSGDPSAMPAGALDITSVIRDVLAGGGGGAIVTFVIGLIKNKLAAK